MKKLTYLQLSKDEESHFNLASKMWIDFNHEIDLHDGITETDDEILADLRRRIAIQGNRSDMHFEVTFLGSEIIGISMFAIDLGTVYGLLEKGYGTIMGFYIKPEYRRKGYGKEMYEHIETLLKHDGAPKIYLTPDGVTGEPFWTALGFENSGKIDPDNEKYIYIKDI